MPVPEEFLRDIIRFHRLHVSKYKVFTLKILVDLYCQGKLPATLQEIVNAWNIHDKYTINKIKYTLALLIRNGICYVTHENKINISEEVIKKLEPLLKEDQ